MEKLKARTRPSIYPIAFVLLMVIAAGEALFLASLISQEHSETVVAAIGGPERMRTQRIAFLTTQAVAPGLTPAERAEFATSISALRSGQHEIDSNPATRVGIPGPGGTTDLEIVVERYADAADDVLQHGASARASYNYIIAERAPLLKALDTAIEARKTAGARRLQALWFGFGTLLALMAAVVFATWRFVVAPLEQRLTQSRQAVRSLFEDNPQAVLTCDTEGRILTANSAASEVLAKPSQKLEGSTIGSLVSSEDNAAAMAAFERCLGGDATQLQLNLLGGGEIAATLSPTIVNGRIAGVYVIARDVTEQRRAERDALEQAQRIHDLCLLAASAGQPHDQIVRAIALGCERMNLSWGFVARSQHGVPVIEASVGRSPFENGTPVRIDPSFVQRVFDSEDLLAIDDLSGEAIVEGVTQAFGSFISVPLEAGTGRCAVAGFAGWSPRGRAISEPDKDFVRLIGALIGAAMERRQQRDKLDAMAFSDPLTGLPNRALLDSRLKELIPRALRNEERFAVHFVDLDGFKALNDEAGHAVGDAALCWVSEHLKTVVGETDTVARLGGDEFIVVQPISSDVGAVCVLADKIVKSLSEPFAFDDRSMSMGASVGVALFPNDGLDVKTLFGKADKALYRAKAAGRGRYECAGEWTSAHVC